MNTIFNAYKFCSKLILNGLGLKIVNREYLDCGLKRSILGCRNSVPDNQSEGESWRDLLAADFDLGPAPAVVGMWGGNE